jgi:hypothetical protein
MREKIPYKEVEKLGFKRKPFSDHMFFEEHGFECFTMELKAKNIVFDWNIETHHVDMIRYKKVDRQSTLEVNTLEELKVLVDFYTAKGNKKVNLPKRESSYINYA